MQSLFDTISFLLMLMIFNFISLAISLLKFKTFVDLTQFRS